MNYLAHLYLANLTSNDPLALIGNLMGDFVKGPLRDQYPEEVLAGIRLHRKIDSYTDNHEQVRRSRALFEPPLRRFAGIVVDIGFDHFLSRYWHRFANDGLDEFAAYCYTILQEHHEMLPERLQLMLPRMIEYDLLSSYGSMQRLERVFGGVSGRVRNGEPIAGGAQFIATNYSSLETHFLEFFPDLMGFTAREYASASRGDG